MLRVGGLTLARACGVAANGISLILLARWLGPADFGEFSAAWAIIVTVSGISGLGLPIFALREAVLGNREATGYAIFLNILTSVAGGMIGFGLSAAFGELSFTLLALMALTMAFEKNAEVRIGLGTEFGKSVFVNWAIALRGIISLLLMLGFFALGVIPLFAFTFARVVAMGIAMGALVVMVQGWPLVVKRPNPQSVNLLRQIALQNGVASVRGIDVALVASIGGSITAGFYSGVQKITMPVTILADSLRTVMLGPIARADNRRVRKYALVAISSGVAAATVLGAISIFANSIVVWLLGPDFAAAASAFRWALLLVPAIGVLRLLLTILQDKGFAASATLFTLVFTAMILASVAIGTHFWGATGAMAGYTITMWLWTAALALKILLAVLPVREHGS